MMLSMILLLLIYYYILMAKGGYERIKSVGLNEDYPSSNFLHWH